MEKEMTTRISATVAHHLQKDRLWKSRKYHTELASTEPTLKLIPEEMGEEVTTHSSSQWKLTESCTRASYLLRVKTLLPASSKINATTKENFLLKEALLLHQKQKQSENFLYSAFLLFFPD